VNELSDQLLDTWRINNRIDLYLLNAAGSDGLGAVAASKGRSVGEHFAHLHNVRLMWLKSAEPGLLEGLSKIEKEQASDLALLADALERSSQAMERLLEKGLEQGRIKGFKPHAAGFLGYMLAHEGHHRGQIMLALKQAGRPVDRKVAYGLWEWGVR